ncbi:Hypothetical predicted protein [Mytilus galloprovincialis]|uniref:L-Fucosyltransferase n=1 Tax=Mytilus galloprovincialis TaxID=29158 RepID=A0A8B6HR58_MYTGA|nr:Hypothetical predicted protein [Mytilus galloprovincialis]
MSIIVTVCIFGLYVFLSSTQTEIVPHIKGHLCPDWTGRLGNLMFQYASLFGIAKRNDMVLTIHEDDEITSVFDNLFALKLNNNSVCEHAQTWGEMEPCLYDILAATIPSNRNVKQMSLLQSWKYFNHVEQAIKEQFRFNQKIESKCQKMLNDAIIAFTSIHTKIPVEKLQVVGIHIRRGDYLDKDKIAHGYQTADEEHIKKSINYFRSKFNYVLFLAYTSYYWKDLLWREKHLVGSDVVRMRVNSPEVDICVLSKCNHSIITVRSFGWWAACFANGTTIYYKNVAKLTVSIEMILAKT